MDLLHLKNVLSYFIAKNQKRIKLIATNNTKNY